MRSEGREMEHKITDEELAGRAQAGDGGAEEMLLRRYFRMPEYKSTIYYIAGADRDDVFQEGMIGLLKAVRTYDAERGASFRTYAEQCVRNTILNAVKSASRDKHRPLNEYEPLDEDVTMAAADEPKDELFGEDLPAALSPLERRVLGGYIEGMSYEAIAREMDIDTKAVDNAMQRAKKKIRALLFTS